MPDYIRFETNIPQAMAFTYTDGREVEGRFGAQYFRGTSDGRGVFLPPIVERKLLELDIQPGEPVEICKAEVKEGRRRSIQWQVKRADPPQSPGQAQPPARGPASGAPPARETAPPANLAHPVQPKPNGTATPNHIALESTSAPQLQGGAGRPITHTQIGNILRACLCAAIDAARDAQMYATSHGFPLTFGADQIQDLASTLYIQEAKQSNIRLMHSRDEARVANGGASWQH